LSLYPPPNFWSFYVTTDKNGYAYVSFPFALTSKPKVIATADTDGVVVVVYSWYTDSAGRYTGVALRAYRLTPSVSTSTGTFLTGVSVQADTSSSWSTDSSGYARHTHPVSTTTSSALTSVSLTQPVAAGVGVHVVVFY
jgi:hypothetical protein